MPCYDAVVLGCGGIGSAALYQLARRGLRVLGLDQFGPPHDRGSSHGSTRLIRQAYFEHPDYVPLLLRAYDLWNDLAQHVGRQLYFETGLLQIGPPAGAVIPGVLASARQHGLEVESLTAVAAQRRWGGFAVPEAMAAAYERRAGYLLVEACVQAHLDAAQAAGAELKTYESVRRWSGDGKTVQIETDRARYEAARLVVTAGPWAGPLLQELGVPLQVRRKPFFYFENHDEQLTAAGGCPTFFYELPQGNFYGVPQIDPRGVKIAEHSGGEPVADPLLVDRAQRAGDYERVAGFSRAHLPALSAIVREHAVCMYTMSPDEHFLVDRHPAQRQVVFAAGLSGHGFKFAPVLAEALAELALDGSSTLPVDFLSLRRLARF